MAKFSKSDMKYFAIARDEAMKSTYETFHLGCVMVYKGHILSVGHNENKTHPAQAMYNRYRKFKYGPQLIKDTLHAEIAALLDIPYAVDQETDWSKVKVYVYRVCNGGGKRHGMARCCPACMRALRDKGVRKIYYTTDDGYAYEEID